MENEPKTKIILEQRGEKENKFWEWLSGTLLERHEELEPRWLETFEKSMNIENDRSHGLLKFLPIIKSFEVSRE